MTEQGVVAPMVESRTEFDRLFLRGREGGKATNDVLDEEVIVEGAKQLFNGFNIDSLSNHAELMRGEVDEALVMANGLPQLVSDAVDVFDERPIQGC